METSFYDKGRLLEKTKWDAFYQNEDNFPDQLLTPPVYICVVYIL